MIYLPYLVHYLHRFLRPFFQQKLRSFITEEVQEEQVDDTRSCQDYDPDNSPIIYKIEESCDNDGPYWEPDLHKNWVFLSFLLSDDLPEEKKADIDTDIRTKSAQKHSNSSHVDINTAGDEYSSNSDRNPTDEQRPSSSPVISKERYD